MYFDGSVCSKGRGIGCLIVSPNGIEYEVSTRLEFEFTNNQSEYEAVLNGLEIVVDMGVRKVWVFGDSQFVVQQLNGDNQCLDETLNEYQEMCLKIISSLEEFSIQHIPRSNNTRVNELAQ